MTETVVGATTTITMAETAAAAAASIYLYSARIRHYIEWCNWFKLNKMIIIYNNTNNITNYD